MAISPTVCVTSVVQSPAMVAVSHIEESPFDLEHGNAIVSIVVGMGEMPVASHPSLALIDATVTIVVTMVDDRAHAQALASSHNVGCSHLTTHRYAVQLFVAPRKGAAHAIGISISVVS